MIPVEEHYEVKCDWDGKIYLGLTLDWDYHPEFAKQRVHLSMPQYVTDILKRFKHDSHETIQHQPHPHVPPNYSKTP